MFFILNIVFWLCACISQPSTDACRETGGTDMQRMSLADVTVTKCILDHQDAPAQMFLNHLTKTPTSTSQVTFPLPTLRFDCTVHKLFCLC